MRFWPFWVWKLGSISSEPSRVTLDQAARVMSKRPSVLLSVSQADQSMVSYLMLLKPAAFMLARKYSPMLL